MHNQERCTHDLRLLRRAGTTKKSKALLVKARRGLSQQKWRIEQTIEEEGEGLLVRLDADHRRRR
jgi:hypothetical protein